MVIPVPAGKMQQINLNCSINESQDSFQYIWNENDKVVDKENEYSLTLDADKLKEYHNYNSTVRPPVYSCQLKDDSSKKKYFSLEVHCELFIDL